MRFILLVSVTCPVPGVPTRGTSEPQGTPEQSQVPPHKQPCPSAARRLWQDDFTQCAGTCSCQSCCKPTRVLGG